MKKLTIILSLLLIILNLSSQVIIVGDTVIDKEGKLALSNHPTRIDAINCKQFSLDNKLKLSCTFITTLKRIETSKIVGYIDENLLVLDGDYITYYSNGDTMDLVQFKNGEKIGKQVKFNKDGRKLEELNVISTLSATYTLFYPNGAIKMVSSLYGNVKQGEEVHYYENGNVKARIIYNANQIDGKFVCMKSDGTEDKVFHFKKGELAKNFNEFKEVIDTIKINPLLNFKLMELRNDSIVSKYLDQYTINISLEVLPNGKVDNLNFNKLPSELISMFYPLFMDSAAFIPEKFMGEYVPTVLTIEMQSNENFPFVLERNPYFASLNNNLYHPNYILSSKGIVYSYVEEMPVFPGGMEAMYQFLSMHIKYPEEAREKGISGRVFVSFIVDKTGLLRDFTIQRGINPVLDKEALRVVNAMPPWRPGKQNGSTVNVQMSIPINFSIKNK